MGRETKAVAAAMIAILSWSTVATAFKMALVHMSWFSLLVIATTTTALLLAVVVVANGEMHKLAKTSPKELRFDMMLGLINPAIYYTILFTAYDLLPAQLALPLNYTWPIMFIILTAFINRSLPKKREIIGVLISFLGIVTISTYSDGVGTISVLGLALALFSAVVWAYHWLLRAANNQGGNRSLFVGFTTAAILLNIIALCAGVNPYENGLPYAIYVGLFEMGVPFICWNYALKQTSNKTFINQISYIAPVLSLLLINFYLGESVQTTTLVGAAAIIGGIVFSTLSKEKKQKI